MGLLARIPARLRPALLRRVINFYPPYLGAGVRVERIAPDWRDILVSMDLRWYNRNYVGTHFGGSLYAMVDPFFMLMLLHLLGDDYVVWDRSSRIDFEAPGRGRVWARFSIDDALLAEIRSATADGAKMLPTLHTSVFDGGGRVVARVAKTIYIRRKKGRR
jgi:acyl-coenzyme A thioesterase PaaI-like protein